MLEHSKLVQEIRRGTDWGVTVPTINIDFPKLMQRKDKVVQELLTNSLKHLSKMPKLRCFAVRQQ